MTPAPGWQSTPSVGKRRRRYASRKAKIWPEAISSNVTNGIRVGCLNHHPGGLDDLAGLFKGHVDHNLVMEGLQKISDKFQSPEHIGPKPVADFEGIEDEEERAMKKRDAFERVDYFLRQIGIR